MTVRFAVLVALTVIVLVAVAIARATPGDVLANLGRNLLTTVAVALLAYLWFYFWTSYRATTRLRSQASARPESLFSVPPRIGRAGRVFGRRELVEEIAAKVTGDSRIRPQLIVGDTGSGKTSLLLALADHFAQLRIIPIVVSLRDVDSLDFAEMAKIRFKEYVEPHVSTDADAEKLWRWVCRRRDVVLLCDDLDRAKARGPAPDPYNTDARVSLEAAARRQLPLVVTSRADGLPPRVNVDVTALGPLQLTVDEAVEELRKWLGCPEDEDEAVRMNLEQGKLTVNPFYFGVVADLLRLRSLQRPPNGGEHAVRVALLGAWHEALLGGDTVPIQERRSREEVFDHVSDFAATRLPPRALPVDPAPTKGRWLQALHAAEQFDLLEVDEKGEHNFKHDAMHAYFASRTLTSKPELLLGALKRAPDAPRVQLALVFAAAATHDQDFCEKACAALLTSSAEVADERRLLRAGAAAEIARAGAFHDLDERIATTCVQVRRYASPLVRRATLYQLSRLSGERAVNALWEFAGDDDYDVRWAAAEQLVERCSGTEQMPVEMTPETFVSGAHAYRALAVHIERHMDDADRLSEPRDDWTPEILPLKHMAWILPALRTAMKALKDSDLDNLVSGHLERLIDLESRGVSCQKGLEASLAQGFKVDAQRNREGGVDEDARVMLDRAEFWYSQLNLVHAITVRAAYSAEPGEAWMAGQLPVAKPHPFLRAAARLCDEALEQVRKADDPQIVDRYVWKDEGELVSGPPNGLVKEAIQLVGDIVVLLNMNETGDEKDRDDFGKNNDLPYCMEQSYDRKQLLEGCVGGDRCKFRRCPYQPAFNRLSAHREISGAFCAHQHRNASAKVARLWDSQVKERALRDFWSDLESKARM